MESIPIPTPRVYGWDSEGVALGVPCFFSGFIEGESLLRPMLAGEVWAERLYIDSVCSLQTVTREQLTNAELQPDQGETAEDVLNKAYEFFKSQPHPLAEAAYEILIATMPTFPELRFSNGDLWLDNFIVRDQELIGIIDFENAGFSDPIFEFLLSFFVEPKLQERGIEQRYMDQAGYDADVLPWYHGLEYFDTWHWVKKLDEPFMHHTTESLEIDLKNWIDGV
jgi:aminoglycoside phosphotransferase (APT) family kinase protein